MDDTLMSTIKHSPIRFVVFFIAIIALLYGVVYYYRTLEYSRKTRAEKLVTGTVLIQDLSKLMVLPSLQPTIATVIDADMLRKSSSFFKTAKTGDTLFIYPDKVILFDSGTRKIVDVGIRSQKTITISNTPTQ